MAVTYSCTPMGSTGGSYRSRLNNSLVSVAAGTPEVITLVHRLLACPHEIRVALRSSIAMPSGMPLKFMVRSYNASQALIDVGAGGADCNAGEGMYDIICEQTHSIFQ